MSAKTKTIESVGTDRVRISGDVTVEELYEAKPDLELYVEPLSATQPLGDFLLAGGVGFGSSVGGTFGGQICGMKGVHEGLRFTYAQGIAPLYNVGYPLQRIVEGPNDGLLKEKFERMSEMVLRARKRTNRKLSLSATDTPELPAVDGTAEAFFVNATAAKAMGLSGAGVVTASEGNGEGDQAWAKRFILDSLPSGHASFVALTQSSGAKALQEAHAAKHAEGVFMALAVHLGVLVVASASAGGVEELAAKADGLQFTWRVM